MKRILVTLLVVVMVLAALIPSLPLTHAQGQPTVALSPSTYTATQINQVFTLTISISNVQGLWGWSADVYFNSQYLSLTTVTEGNFIYNQVGGTGSTLFADLPATVRNQNGHDEIDDASASDETASGSGTLATLEFTVLARVSQTTIDANFTLLGPAPTTHNYTSSTTGANPVITPVSSTSDTTVTLQANLPPEANAGPNQSVLAGAPIVFNASASISSGNNPTYSWSFLDGTKQENLTGIIVDYTFKNPGTYVVTLTVQDSLGTDTSNLTVTVLNSTYTPATITISGATGGVINVGQSVLFSIEASTLRSVPVQNYLWSMGDGKTPTKTVDGNLTYSYGASGTYTVNVTITYTDGIKEFATTTATVGQSTQATQTPGSTGASPASSSSDGASSGTNDDSASLPPTVLGIIIVMTLFVLGGSVVWLRNQRNPALTMR